MTIDEAIEILKDGELNPCVTEDREACDMAIKAIEQQRPYEKFESVKDHIYKLAGDYKCWDNRLTDDEALELCHILEQEPRKDEVILTKEEYGELVSSEFDNGYAKGYREALEQESVLGKIRAEIKALNLEPTAYDVVDGNPIKDAVWETLADVLKIIDKYKAESEGKR